MTSDDTTGTPKWRTGSPRRRKPPNTVSPDVSRDDDADAHVKNYTAGPPFQRFSLWGKKTRQRQLVVQHQWIVRAVLLAALYFLCTTVFVVRSAPHDTKSSQRWLGMLFFKQAMHSKPLSTVAVVVLDEPTAPYVGEMSAMTTTTIRHSHHHHMHLPVLPTNRHSNYGGLNVYDDKTLHRIRGHHNTNKLRPRMIRPDMVNQYENERAAQLKEIDDRHMSSRYYSFQDREWDPEDCVIPAWAYDSYMNCNNFHELDLSLSPHQIEQTFDISYLAHGYYRETYSFVEKQHVQRAKKGDNKTSEYASGIPFVLKHIRMKDHLDFNYWYYKSMHNEGLVMEALSASPRTSNIYGYCAFSLMVEKAKDFTFHMVPELESQSERGRMLQKDLDRLQQHDVHPMNELTVPEKLNAAIAMAESLAEMHGYARGVIVHDDFHPDQFLVTDDGRLILNDINNAVVLGWNAQKQEYCPYESSYGGDFRAPEEFQGDATVDESVDMWPMGHMIFSLLTGLWPYYGEVDTDINQKIALKGIPPYIDPRYQNRSFIEGRLVEIMNRCYKRNPQRRANIFDVVRHLRETRRMYEAQQ